MKNQVIYRHSAENIVRNHRRTQSSSPSPQSYSYRAPWYRAIDWEVVSKYLCMGMLACCLIYLGIFVFVPFAGGLIDGR